MSEETKQSESAHHVPGYSKSIHVDHKGAAELFDGPVIVQEKVDGSQFSFFVDEQGVLHARSNKTQLNIDFPHMFTEVVEYLKTVSHLATPGWVYRGEYLRKPKHNSLKYDRAPKGYLVLWDIMFRPENYLAPDDVAKEAAKLGFDVVPTYHIGPLTRDQFHERLKDWVKTPPLLGGKMVEGVVVKNYAKFNPIDRRILFCKYVTEEFKEIHAENWHLENPKRGDVVRGIIEALGTPQRFEKARQRGVEAGAVSGEMRDLAFICKEIPRDLREEAADYVKDRLFEYFWPEIMRGVMGKVPPWYKAHLAQAASLERVVEANRDAIAAMGE